ncbi:MAG: hypothetical protein AAGK67_14625 [Pseudomonadota bacterium]
MYQENESSIAAFGYREAPSVDFPRFVHEIDMLLQKTDKVPRQILWPEDNIAMIDRDGLRIALGFLPPSENERFSYIIVGVCTLEDLTYGVQKISNMHLVDKLVQRIKVDIPYDTIMRGETPEPVNEALLYSMFDLLRAAFVPEGKRSDSDSVGVAADETAMASYGVILSDDVEKKLSQMPPKLARTKPPLPVRLVIHALALSVTLITPPLGAFLFTYSVLRDFFPSKKTA